MYFHLIGYAEKNLTAIELKQILEEPMQTGETLFSAASYNSLPIASDLIGRNIEINFINDLFMTPQARFSQSARLISAPIRNLTSAKNPSKFTFNEITGQMIKKGVNPFVFTNTDDRFYDKYRSHFNGYG